MTITFKQYLLENIIKNGTINAHVLIAHHIDDDISTEVSIEIKYSLIDGGQSYDHDGPDTQLDEESIDYEVSKSFEYNNKQYNGSDLVALYQNVFFDDDYVKQSSILKNNISEYFMKPNLSDNAQESVFMELLKLIIKEQENL